MALCYKPPLCHGDEMESGVICYTCDRLCFGQFLLYQIGLLDMYLLYCPLAFYSEVILDFQKSSQKKKKSTVIIYLSPDSPDSNTLHNYKLPKLRN